MNKSLLLASLVAAVALAACGKKEEAAPAAPRCRLLPRLSLPPPPLAASAPLTGRLRGALAAAVGRRCRRWRRRCRCRCRWQGCRNGRLRRDEVIARSSRTQRSAKEPPSGGFFAFRCSGASRRAAQPRASQPAPAAASATTMSDGSAPQAAASACGGQRRAVVLLAQVGRDHVAQPGVMARARMLRRAVVGQVAVRAADARLERRRVARLREQRAVVVALQHQRIAALQLGQQVRRCSSPRRSARPGAAGRRCRCSCSGSSASCGTVNGCSSQVADDDRPRRRGRSAAGRRAASVRRARARCRG